MEKNRIIIVLCIFTGFIETSVYAMRGVQAAKRPEGYGNSQVMTPNVTPKKGSVGFGDGSRRSSDDNESKLSGDSNYSPGQVSSQAMSSEKTSVGSTPIFDLSPDRIRSGGSFQSMTSANACEDLDLDGVVRKLEVEKKNDGKSPVEVPNEALREEREEATQIPNLSRKESMSEHFRRMSEEGAATLNRILSYGSTCNTGPSIEPSIATPTSNEGWLCRTLNMREKAYQREQVVFGESRRKSVPSIKKMLATFGMPDPDKDADEVPAFCQRCRDESKTYSYGAPESKFRYKMHYKCERCFLMDCLSRTGFAWLYDDSKIGFAHKIEKDFIDPLIGLDRLNLGGIFSFSNREGEKFLQTTKYCSIKGIQYRLLKKFNASLSLRRPSHAAEINAQVSSIREIIEDANRIMETGKTVVIVDDLQDNAVTFLACWLISQGWEIESAIAQALLRRLIPGFTAGNYRSLIAAFHADCVAERQTHQSRLDIATRGRGKK